MRRRRRLTEHPILSRVESPCDSLALGEINEHLRFAARTHHFWCFLRCLLGLVCHCSGGADVRILSSSGGMVEDYLRTFAQLRRSGERIIIDGPCFSACTLVLSTIPKNRICVTRRAVLGFHAAQWVDSRSGRVSRAPEATRIVTQSYPPGVRAWIKKRGGLTGKPIYLRGRELGSLYRRC